MSVRDQLKLLIGGENPRRSPPPAPGTAGPREFFERSRLVASLIFVFTVAAIVVISSAGVNTANFPVLPNQLATMRVVAGASFNYESAEKTRIAREQLLDRVPPVYRLDFDPLQQFETAARELLGRLEHFEQSHPPSAPAFESRRAELTEIADTFNARGPYHITPEDLSAVLAAGDARARASLFETGLAALRDLYAEGVHDGMLSRSGSNGVMVFQVIKPTGEIAQRPAQSMEEALTFLRVNLSSDNVPRASTLALVKLFRNGLAPNLVFDRAATQLRQDAAIAQMKPVMVNVVRGQTIIEPGQRVTPEQYEMLLAHRKYLFEHADTQLDENLTLLGRILLVLAMVIASALYIRLEDRETFQSNGRLGLLAIVVIINLALVRVVYSIGGAEFFVHDGTWASTLPYVAPTALAPLIVAILIDAGSAIFMALLISIFTGIIYGNRLDLIVLTFLASMVAIFSCRDAHQRSRVVRAAAAGGLTLAVYALPVGLADQVPAATLMRQMIAGLATGLFTGVVVVGVLPVLESLFKRTTDITLLELTDYNHPLLRRMQLEAPGTYHHSLVVAQLSENAAGAIGANALLARVCALFHDIGKIPNPGYFAENLRNGANPHDQIPPAESARIIKQHVPDGVELAQRHHLPRAVIDVIQQHHGTGLVRYFYDRAVTQSRPDVAVSEAVYRYDGPPPQFKESAIISLADGVEAASRSLRQATMAQLSELIERIVHERIEDLQLDQAPLTFVELARIKNSFQFTLLNMLHGRVAYPTAEPASNAAKA